MLGSPLRAAYLHTRIFAQSSPLTSQLTETSILSGWATYKGHWGLYLLDLLPERLRTHLSFDSNLIEKMLLCKKINDLGMSLFITLYLQVFLMMCVSSTKIKFCWKNYLATSFFAWAESLDSSLENIYFHLKICLSLIKVKVDTCLGLLCFYQ